MATLSAKVNILRPIIILAILLMICHGRQVLAAGKDAKNTKTEAATEVFDVKEKDLPTVSPPTATNTKVPAPDLKEFSDEKFINNLLGESGKPSDNPADKSADVNSAKTKTDTPAPASQATSAKPEGAATSPKPDAVIDDLLGGQEPAKPAAEAAPSPAAPAVASPGTAPVVAESPAPAAAQSTAPPPAAAEAQQPAPGLAAETPAGAPVAATQQEKSQPAPAVTEQAVSDKPSAAAANLPKADVLTDEEKAAYSDLKKHLINFIASYQTGAPNVVAAQPESVVKEANVDSKENLPVKTSDATVQTQTPAAPEPTPSVSAPSAPTAPDAAAAAAPKAVPEAVTKKSVDEFDDFLEPTKQAALEKNSDKASNKGEKKVVTTPPPSETKEEVAKAPIIPDTKADVNSAPAPVANAKLPEKKITQSLSAEKPNDVVKEVVIAKEEAQKPPVKEKLSEADKAYFKLLDKKRDTLPEDKRLSESSKGTIDDVASAIAPVKKSSKKDTQYIKVERGTKGAPAIEENGLIKSQGKVDLVIKKADKNEDSEKSKVKMEKAYKALLVGQIAAAISVYKEVLEKEPDNKDAMFGLATAYHKNSQYEQARTIYTKLLKNEPSNKEALNNFLVLVAEEAPEDALIELEKLERINSDFSPIPAQIAMINLKLGNAEKAARYLRRAILLSPENVSYKYNLAITYDKLGKQEQAVQLYHQIISAVRGGAVIPGSIDKLMERTAYLEARISDKK